ncbi:MAG TPA: CHASE2 domain-containing protein, partial [Candidatus Brocadiales bacterium]|nr:CHASE2 domain-containing protein [Candidatus Brocadiales bacterium]
MKHSLLKALVIGIISTVLVIPFTFTELYRALELRFYDQRLKLRPLHPVTDKVVLIAIDDDSIKTLGRWPWSRDRHAILIDTLTSLDAKGISLDIEFLEESPATLEKEVVADSLKGVRERLRHLQSMPNPPGREQAGGGNSGPATLLVETRAMEEVLAGMLKDYDKELARSMALSGRTYLAFHPVDPLPPESPLRPLYPTLKGVLTREDVTSAEGLAGKLPLNKKQSKELVEYFPFLKKQVLLELVEAEIKKNPDITLG